MVSNNLCSALSNTSNFIHTVIISSALLLVSTGEQCKCEEGISEGMGDDLQDKYKVTDKHAD